jgi:inhibitor of cysteine peptidase
MTTTTTRPRSRFVGLGVLLVAIAVLAAACDDASSANAHTVTLTSDRKTEVVLKTGDTLVISLASNPSTGYSWEATSSDPDVVSPKGSTNVRPKNAPPGAGGRQNLSFLAVKAGTATLTLVYDRPFAKGSPGNKTVVYTVTVR